jgi:hypothetical protein
MAEFDAGTGSVAERGWQEESKGLKFQDLE